MSERYVTPAGTFSGQSSKTPMQVSCQCGHTNLQHDRDGDRECHFGYVMGEWTIPASERCTCAGFRRASCRKVSK